jgi:phosphatidylserine/phosphatidylglycerophosphate/cardiolipin synthase-like enzyme
LAARGREGPFAAILLALFICLTPIIAWPAGLPSDDVQLQFDPGLERVVLQEITACQSSIELEMYKLTDRPVIRALQRAAQQGVLVRVILCLSEKDNLRAAKKLLTAGVQQLWYPLSRPNQIMHLKMAIFDHQKMIFGSSNWTFSGLNINHEGILILEKPEIISQALDRFENDWRVSTQNRP